MFELIKRYGNSKSGSFGSFSDHLSFDTASKNDSLYKVFKGEDENRSNRLNGREDLLDSFDRDNVEQMREISNGFYTRSIMYRRLIHYFADMFTYSWAVYPNLRRPHDITQQDKDDLHDKWWDALDYIEAINPEWLGPSISLDVMLNGETYIVVKESVEGGNIESTNGDEDETVVGIQKLPLDYCRTTKTYRGRDMVDFNVKFFTDQFRDDEERKVALQVFPKVISDAYYEYEKSKKTRGSEWVTLDPDYAFRFSLGDGTPVLVAALLDIMDLQDVKDITMYKLEQEISKLLVQQFGFDKDGQPTVTLPVLEEFHASTANMLQGVFGVDVITTLADVFSVDLQKQKESASNNPLDNAVTSVHNSVGVSELLFNATSSGALAKALSVDESFMFPLVKQIEDFLRVRVHKNFSEKGGAQFKVTVLLVTHTNRKDMVALYKEQTALGFAKFLPAIALGQRQSDIMSALYFENEVLDLVSMMRPPASSNTMSAKQASEGGKKDGPGRPEKSEEDRSEKTIANRESA